MKKSNIPVHLMSMTMAAAMIASSCPSSVLAVENGQIAKDGTYIVTKHVTNNPENEEDWNEYDVTVSLTVKDGKFEKIEVVPTNGYEDGNASYLNKAYNRSKGIATKLKDLEATYENVDGWDTVSGATCTSDAIKAAALEAIKAAPQQPQAPVIDTTESENAQDDLVGKPAVNQEMYVMMNIPYSVFYSAELSGGTGTVDTVTSATGNKVKNERFVAGAYINNQDKILGVTYPVKVTEDMLTGLTKVDSEAALLTSGDYAYAVMTTTPSYYKEMTVSNGVKRFGEVKGSVSTLSSATATLSTSSRYGDYEIAVDGLPENLTVSGIVLKTTDGAEYGLRHLENIWFNNKLSFSVGHKTVESHGNTLSYAHYKSMEGKTLASITYITATGIYEINAGNMYLPLIADASVTVENASVSVGKTTIKMDGLPSGYSPKYSVDGLEGAFVTTSFTGDGATLTYSKEKAQKGSYTLKVEDSNGYYAPINVTFELYTEAMPAMYNEKDALVKSEDATDEEFADYISNIASVTVNGTSYTAKGKHSVKIINEDGSINKEAAPFAEDESFEMVVNATGYLPYSFTYTKTEEEIYVMMNIPYAKFYAADVNNSVEVDVFTSATKNKVRTGGLSGGSYHVDASGDEITGITFPVKVSGDVDLTQYTEVTDENSVDITVTNKGQTSTTTYAGVEALYESPSYAYYKLSEAPKYYKEATANEDGSLSFGEVQGNAMTLTGIDAELMTTSNYGDYQMNLDGARDAMGNPSKVYGVIVDTTDGSEYGMRHLENIWRVEELAWVTGFTQVVHNCPTSSAHYESMMGKTINKVTYYTNTGIYEIPVDVYVPVKFECSLEVDSVSVTSGKTTIDLKSLPEGFEASYDVEGLDGMSAEGNELKFDAAKAKKGAYVLKVTDQKGVYAPISATFELYTESMPAMYNEKDALVKAENVTDEAFADYINNITSVTVNEKVYEASGRGAVKIINEDGSINKEAAPFAEGESFEMIVKATGYLPYSFTYNTNVVVDPEEPVVDSEEPVVDPEEPTKPNKPSNDKQDHLISTAPKTGDTMNLFALFGMAVTSLGTGSAAFISRKRNKKNK